MKLRNTNIRVNRIENHVHVKTLFFSNSYLWNMTHAVRLSWNKCQIFRGTHKRKFIARRAKVWEPCCNVNLHLNLLLFLPLVLCILYVMQFDTKDVGSNSFIFSTFSCAHLCKFQWCIITSCNKCYFSIKCRHRQPFSREY